MIGSPTQRDVFAAQRAMATEPWTLGGRAARTRPGGVDGPGAAPGGPAPRGDRRRSAALQGLKKPFAFAATETKNKRVAPRTTFWSTASGGGGGVVVVTGSPPKKCMATSGERPASPAYVALLVARSPGEAGPGPPTKAIAIAPPMRAT